MIDVHLNFIFELEYEKKVVDGAHETDNRCKNVTRLHMTKDTSYDTGTFASIVNEAVKAQEIHGNTSSHC